jgi:hypothetical protein
MRHIKCSGDRLCLITAGFETSSVDCLITAGLWLMVAVVMDTVTDALN